VPRSKTAYDELCSRIIPHYCVLRFSHSMPMNDVCRIVRWWQNTNQRQLSGYLKYLQKRRRRDDRFPSTGRRNQEEQRRISKKTNATWIVSTRKIEIADPAGISHAIGLHHCREITITPRSIIVNSAYAPGLLEKRLQRLFNLAANGSTVSFDMVERAELKLAVPLEFTEYEYLSRLSKKLSQPTPRPFVRSLYCAQAQPGVEIESYLLTGYKDFTYVACGKIHKGRCLRNKTEGLRVAPLEFRIDLNEVRNRLRIPQRATYEHTITKLKEFILTDYLLDKTGQARIPFWRHPEPWLHAPREPRYQPEDIILGKKIGKKRKQVETYPWSLKNYTFDVMRIGFILDQLNAPWEQRLKREWEEKYYFVFPLNIELGLEQLINGQFRAETVGEYLPKGINVLFEQLELYSMLRVYQKHLRNKPTSLKSWLEEYCDKSIPKDAAKRIEKYLDTGKREVLSNFDELFVNEGVMQIHPI